jgi:hypothetical protein
MSLAQWFGNLFICHRTSHTARMASLEKIKRVAPVINFFNAKMGLHRRTECLASSVSGSKVFVKVQLLHSAVVGKRIYVSLKYLVIEPVTPEG